MNLYNLSFLVDFWSKYRNITDFNGKAVNFLFENAEVIIWFRLAKGIEKNLKKY